ncbi:hypothetical protein IB286_06630 [Spongiibacter sp. KMU-158]|uniref:Uncharacterized protein n=1 Tax=Spongiibacter pelagi TaxID=2760804 RepID=A0A927C1Z4_9GAMM|nr:hypothetical protein [Spongiibacter pelagi]MBD2858683.1 hypothetical protein [Spongiibacter pelagi]
MKSSLNKLFGLAALALGVTACGGGGSNGATPVAGENTVVVSTKAADFSGSDIQLIDLSEGYTAQSGVAPTDQSDTTVARYGEYFYRLGRFNIDELSKYSFDAPSTPIYEYSTKNNAEDATSNPYTVVFASQEKAYIIQYGENEVLIVNPSATTEGEFIIGGIDLSAYADADTSGVAEAADGVIVDGKLFVVMQRLVGYSPAETGVSAYIAVFDTSTDQEIDTNPSDAAENLRGIELSTRNPNKFVYQSGVGLFLQSTGDAFYSYAGRDPGYTGGITKIDTQTYSETMIVDDGDETSHPYGFMYNLAIVNAENGYFVGYESYQNYNLYKFNPNTGAVTAIDAYSGLNITEIATGPQSNLWIGIGDAAQPRIELFDGNNTLETIQLNQNPGAMKFAN